MSKSKRSKNRKPRPNPPSGVLPARSHPTDHGVDGRQTGYRALLVVLLLVVPLLPFVSSPFRIDDPLFIWAARNILVHPADPYGFTVNWYGVEAAMSDVTKNPPLTSYYIALVAAAVGFREVALHLAFLLPAAGVAIGTYMVAKKLCANPALAVLSGLLTPVFFLSSLTVMCDVMMLAFWVWASYLWITGLDANDHVKLGFAALLMAAAALSKYFGMMLIPLLLTYSIVKRRRPGWWLLHFALPVAVLAWYQWTTNRLYGRGLLLDAATYATTITSSKTGSALGSLSIPKTYVACTFTGGCIVPALLFARRLWSVNVLITGLVSGFAIALFLASSRTFGSFGLPADEGARWFFAAQLALWGVAGISIIVLAGLDLWRARDAESLLLFLWTLGTFLFAGFVNWSTNGRSILPMIVPVGILIVRRLELNARPQRLGLLRRAAIPLVSAAALSLAVTWADSRLAETARQGARQIHEKFGAVGRTVWFQGHWGFQFYMEQGGAKAVDVQRSRFASGDLVVVPTTNTNLFPMPHEWAFVKDVVDVPSSGVLTTMNGAGFYSDVFGPLPFVFGPVAPERFTVYEVRRESTPK
jgi:4-amino-4-deoxy-L-arabinose transferase-like glycosyltransferase